MIPHAGKSMELFDIVDTPDGKRIVTCTYARRKDYDSRPFREWLGDIVLICVRGEYYTLSEALGFRLADDWVDCGGTTREEWAYRLWHAAAEDSVEEAEILLMGKDDDRIGQASKILATV